MEKSGYYKGRHYSAFTDDVRKFKREGKLEQAEALLRNLVKATEAEALAENLGVAPWYYDELAKIYRKRRDCDAEIKILERFAGKKHAPGVNPPKLLARLEKAKQLRAKADKQR